MRIPPASRSLILQDLISLGRFLLLPSDDLSLAEILKSPLFGLNDDDLIDICCGREGKTVWSSLASNPKYNDVYSILQNLCNFDIWVEIAALLMYNNSQSGK